MLNQIILVGRIQQIIDNGVVISVPASYKNEKGEYDNNIITINIEGAIYTNMKEYCNNGDVIGVKGHIKSVDGNMQIIAEKVSFLSSKKEEE